MRSTVLRLAALILWLAGLLTPGLVRAFPPLPASFYGTVKVSDANVPDGTLVRALIDGQVYAEARTQTYEGNTVYSVDVKGDDPATPEREGGSPEAVVTFEVGGVQAEQSGIWRSGTNVALHLTARTSGALASPPPTLPPVATQTPIRYLAPPPTASPAPVTPNSGGGAWLISGSAAIAILLSAIWVVRRRRR